VYIGSFDINLTVFCTGESFFPFSQFCYMLPFYSEYFISWSYKYRIKFLKKQINALLNNMITVHKDQIKELENQIKKQG